MDDFRKVFGNDDEEFKPHTISGKAMLYKLFHSVKDQIISC